MRANGFWHNLDLLDDHENLGEDFLFHFKSEFEEHHKSCKD